MPEIKNAFNQGKMNKDLDERIVPNGQYREALNVQVSTSDGSDIGALQNIRGNKNISSARISFATGGWSCVGSIPDEKNNKLYWFITRTNADAIVEYDSTTGVTTPILVDTNLDVLKFEEGEMITGINIVDNLLFWTDGKNEPKKINIDNFKGNAHTNFNNHSDFIVNGVGTGEVKEEHITLIKKKPTKAPKMEFEVVGEGFSSGVFDSFSFDAVPLNTTIQLTITLENFMVEDAGVAYDPDGDGTANSYTDATGANLGVLDGSAGSANEINAVYDAITYPTDLEDATLLLSDPAAQGTLPTNVQVRVYVDTVNTPILSDNSDPNNPIFTQTFTCELLSIDSGTPSQSIQYDFTVEDLNDLLFDKVFPRFAYRYKYQDGEYSAFGPFTQVGFSAGEFSIHPTREPYNSAMDTRVKAITLKDFVTNDIPSGVVEIDLLYKPENAPIIYSIDTITPKKSDGSSNPEWTTIDGTSTTINLPITSAVTPSDTGYYRIVNENIYAAIPSNQILRPWDNVPKKAKSQDFTANRLIYGNYTQNLNLGDYKPHVALNYEERTFAGNSVNFDVGKESIKSQRTYQAGVVFGDEHGRETPVFTSKDGSIKVPYDKSTTNTFQGTARLSNRLYFKNIDPPLNIKTNEDLTLEPYYFKVFIKETATEYYNLVMDRAYRAEEDGNLWVSFPSSERNKLQEDEYIILKKSLESDEQVPLENKFKVIDIKNEAPDFIKKKFVSLGQCDGDGDLSNLYNDPSVQPTEQRRHLVLSKESMFDQGVDDLQVLFNKDQTISFNFSITTSTGAILKSDMYEIANLVTETGNPDIYRVTLNRPIDIQDAWVESTTGTLDSTLKLNVFKQESKEWEEFEGRFFVKILSNLVTDQYIEPQIGSTVINAVDALQFLYNIADDSTPSTGGTMQYTDDSGTQEFAGQTSGTTTFTTNAGTGTTGSAGFKSDNKYHWDNVADGNLLFNSSPASPGSGWFIDSAYVAAFHPTESVDLADYPNATSRANTIYANNPSSHPGIWRDVSLSGNFFKQGFMFNSPNHPLANLAGSSGSWTVPGGNASWYRGEGGMVDSMPGMFTPTNSGQDIRKWVNGPMHVEYEAGKHYMHLSYSGVGVDLCPGGAIAYGFPGTNASWTGLEWQQWKVGKPGGGYQGTNVDLKSIHFYNRHPHNRPNLTGANGAPVGPPGPYVPGNTITYLNYGSLHADNCSMLDKQGQNSSTLGSQSGQDDANHQWDPTYNNPANEDFVGNLKTGSRFSFGNDPEIYTILGVKKVYIYNHTAWNRVVEWDGTNGGLQIKEGTVHKTWRNFWKFNMGFIAGGAIGYWGTQGFNTFRKAVEDFGAADNRRVCYILELDKNPADASSSYNPILQLTDANVPIQMRFMKSYTEEGVTILSDNPAVWETQPKENIDLDIYYEASDAIPLRLDKNTESLDPGDADPDNRKGYSIAPIGTTVRCSETDAHTTEDLQGFGAVQVKSWDGNIVELEPGLDVGPGVSTNDAAGWDAQTTFLQNKKLKFYKDDLSYIETTIYSVREISGTVITKLSLNRTINKKIGLPYFNCYSFGNGVESNRIRDDFNQPIILNGVKASSTLQEQYKEDTRGSGLIYSGLYNKTTSLNDLNQFIMAEKITKQLSPTYGSIQKLFTRNEDIIALCEDKIVQIVADKDVIFNADGNPQLVASNKVLGQSRPFEGEYGISQNPESFASESYRAYFTDKQRGAVLRLSKDGLTPISDAGMTDFFRDKLKEDYWNITGSYDNYKKEYNLTLDGGTYPGVWDEDYDPKAANVSSTVSFSEDVRGWVSFKSFIPESGLSMSGDYYTIRNGALFRHHDLDPGEGGNVGRNNFYNIPALSYVKSLFNNFPGTIKNFNTLNYDGDEGWSAKIETDLQVGSVPVVTNIDGSLSDFVKKEGKWFNYIQGQKTGVDTSAINFQGIGTCLTAEDIQ